MVVALVAALLVGTPRAAESFNFGGLCYKREGSGAPHTSVLQYWDGYRWVYAGMDQWAYDTIGTTRCQWGFSGWWMLQSVWWSIPQGRSYIDVYAWGYNVNAAAAN